MMRDSISKKSTCKLLPNQRIVGRWQKNPYRIIKELGYGATGTVYLAEGQSGLVALKIASDSMSITSEVNVMRQFSKVQGPSLGPSFYEADDYVCKEGVFPFYTMEYIKGEPFLPFLRDKGAEWLGILVVQLLGDLHHLHKAGWVFGDLKPENLLVTKKPFRVRWLDVGGMTKQGRGIKEYTEFFDRGYWGVGNRKAEPSYDLFSVCMLFLNRAYPSRFEKDNDVGPAKLLMKFKEKKLIAPYESIFRKGIEGKYHHAQEMKKDLVDLLQHTSFSVKGNARGNNSNNSLKKRGARNKKSRKEKRFIGFFETMFVASFLLIIYILYLFGQTM
ncbi:serine/threonine protein kinase [Evansella cellulosilytica DSM 2522]|uniref:Serine/threonine protein kinase n=2 Tax=Evansella TaxID=2837485 RepID=E6TSE2_EVAC2|nr:serine/threonine protein kinase [Evansella cellulosilytica]ADU28357.1 serine/threonine protein kinase [Evansella cellulosilytica DSM 2522]